MGLYVRDEQGALLQIQDVTPGPGLYEEEIERLAWENLELFAGDPLFPLRLHAPLPNGGQPDILALDRQGRVVVVEVKRDVDRRQLSQALEYAGWARSTNLDELAPLYANGADAFFQDWPGFTESDAPVVVSHPPRLMLVARDIHPRTRDALRFLIDGGLPVDVVRVSMYEEASGRRLVEIERESEAPAGGGDSTSGAAKTQSSYTIGGRSVRITDLIQAGLLDGGTGIEFTRHGKTTRGEVTSDGNIQVGGQKFATPSAAGKPAVGHSIDGWRYWRVPSRGGVPLAELRAELLNRLTSAAGADEED